MRKGELPTGISEIQCIIIAQVSVLNKHKPILHERHASPAHDKLPATVTCI